MWKSWIFIIILITWESAIAFNFVKTQAIYRERQWFKIGRRSTSMEKCLLPICLENDIMTCFNSNFPRSLMCSKKFSNERFWSASLTSLQTYSWEEIALSISLSIYFIHFIIPFGKFRLPYLGKATAAARAPLPSPTSACWVFSCFRNPPNSVMDYRSLTCVHDHSYAHGGWVHQTANFSVQYVYFYLQRFMLCSREIYQIAVFFPLELYYTPIMGVTNITDWKNNRTYSI